MNESWKRSRKPSLFKFFNEDMPPVLKFYRWVLFKGALLLLVTRMVLYEDMEFVVDKNSSRF